MNEARYSRLTREFPERAGELFERNEKAAIERYDHLVRLKAMYDGEWSVHPARRRVSAGKSFAAGCQECAEVFDRAIDRFRKAGRPKGRPAFFALRPGRSAKLRVSPMYGTEGAQGVR